MNHLPDASIADSDDSLGRLLRLKFRLAIILISLLLLLDRASVQPPLFRLLMDPSTINIAGRQRMLSQRITKFALALSLPNCPTRDRYRGELRGLLKVWAKSHEDLRSRQASVAIRQSFDAIEPVFIRMNSVAESYAGPETPSAQSILELLGAEEVYLDRMEVIVGLLEEEAEARVNALIWGGWLVDGFIIVGLIALQIMLFSPATRTIERQILSLRESRKILEQRVRDRTEEWKKANVALQKEAEERRLADERIRGLLEQISHVSRMNTIGELASGLAHELNQPLGAIANYAEGSLVALAAVDPDLDEVRGALTKLLAATLRAGRIIHRVRRFVTRKSPICEPFDANDAVREVAELLVDESTRRGVTLQTRLALNLPWMAGDAIQIQQVLVNLVRNAMDAFNAIQPMSPLIVMETRLVGTDVIEFRVSDNGEGIDPTLMNLVFDPFFSTRADGMGMGLAICRTIVETHQGTIDVESEPNVHTTFRLTFRTIGENTDAETYRLPR